MTNAQFSKHYMDNLPAFERFAYRLTKDTDSAQDLVQEAMIKAFRSIHTFKKGSSFKSWGFTIIKNTFITNYRRNKRRGIVNAPVEDLIFAADNSLATSNNGITNIRLNEIKSYIEQLSVKSKQPFEMHVNGYKYDEIAKNLNIPVGTVKSRINFARKKLKEAMKSEDLQVA